MKKMITIALISVFGLAGSVYAKVQDFSDKTPAQRTEVFKGSIVSVNVVDSELIVKDLNDEEVTVTVDAATKISVVGRPAKLSKLKAGKNVTVHCRVCGTDVIAQEIRYV